MARKGKHFFSGYRLLAVILIPLLAAGGVFAAQRLGWLNNAAAQLIPVESGGRTIDTEGITDMTGKPGRSTCSTQ